MHISPSLRPSVFADARSPSISQYNFWPSRSWLWFPGFWFLALLSELPDGAGWFFWARSAQSRSGLSVEVFLNPRGGWLKKAGWKKRTRQFPKSKRESKLKSATRSASPLSDLRSKEGWANFPKYGSRPTGGEL